MAERKKTNVSGKISALLFAVLGLLILLDFLTGSILSKLTNSGKLLVYAVIFIIPIIIYLRVNKYRMKTALKLSHVKVRYIPFLLLFALSTSFICALINAGMFALCGGQLTTSTVGFSSGSPLVIAVTMVLMPAVCEELLIRGLALSEYEKYGVAVSVIMTSAVFALFHGSLITIPSLFVAGVFYAVLTHLFRSVYPAIICHLINNALSVFMFCNRDYISYLLSDTLFLIMAAVAIFVIIYLTLRLTEGIIDDLGNKKRLRTDTKRLAYGDPLKSPFIWMFFAVSIFISIMKVLR